MLQLQLLVSGFSALLHVGGQRGDPCDAGGAGDAGHERIDDALTLRIVRSLADEGDAGAQFKLGWMYDIGQGIAQDHGEALKWYRRAAAQGVAQAQTNAGVMYALGRGVARDCVRAHMWFDLAARCGDARALEYRDIIAGKMAPAQIAESQRLGRAWRANEVEDKFA